MHSLKMLLFLIYRTGESGNEKFARRLYSFGHPVPQRRR